MNKEENSALIIIDMVKDNFDETKNLPITSFAKKIIEPINNSISVFRKMNNLIVFSTDSFKKEDFIFKGRMKPHSLSGTRGAEVIDELDREDDDLWLPKPRFSSFFGTNLAKTLKEKNITLCAFAGIATNFCVLTSAMDALCHDFKAVILEDCTAAFSEKIHNDTLSIYRKNPLFPLFQITTSEKFIEAKLY